VALTAGSRLLLFILVLASATGPLSMQILVPALPQIARDFAAGPATTQLTLSLALLAIALSTLVYGPLSDRYGRRPVLIVGMALFVAGGALSAAAPSVGLLICGRVLQAVGAAAGMVLARAVVRDIYPNDQVARVLAALITAVVVAPMVAPTLGGLLADHAGWRAIFMLVAGLGLAILLLVLWQLQETNKVRTRHPRVLSLLAGYGRLLGNRRFLAYALQGSFAMASFYGFISAAPYLMADVLHRPATEYGLWFVAMPATFMAGNMIAMQVSGRFGIDRMVLAGSLLGLAGAGLGLALIAAGLFSPLVLFGPTLLVSVSHGLSMANAQAGAMNVEPALAGTASGLTAFLQMALSAVAAQAVGLLPTDTPWPMSLAMLACMALSLLAYMLLHGNLRGHRPARIGQEARAG
jgi:DHA1 family bicyclomycin/chloramphenicol resistance-like MFS transporter